MYGGGVDSITNHTQEPLPKYTVGEIRAHLPEEQQMEVVAPPQTEATPEKKKYIGRRLKKQQMLYCRTPSQKNSDPLT